ncbi:MAG: ATP-dependent protease, partial [Verrucomicrobiales bacterium]|nr:ATP-dependent protease [Verrucomicrobiales bacterium]
VVCEHLDSKDLFEIMKSSEGSLLRQYEQEFAAYGIQAKFEKGAMEIIAERAALEKTGARGLLTVCERILRDFKFELPGTSVSELKINAELVNNNSKVLEEYKKKGRKVSVGRVGQELELFSSEFLKNHGVRIGFSEDAVEAIGERAVKEGTRPLQLCEFLFKDYQFGLKLIQKNTGKDEFTVDSKAVKDPDSYLSSMVVSSYRDAETK